MSTQPAAYSLLINDDRVCTWLLPTEQAGRIAWQSRSFTGKQLNQVVQTLMAQLSLSFKSGEDPRYCLVAAEDPLTVLLCCLAIWRSQAIAVLPNNLRPTALSALRVAPFQSTEFEQAELTQSKANQRIHPLLDDAALAQALASLVPEWRAPEVEFIENIQAEDVALLCFTSGSTGQPQCHEKRARQVLGEASLLAHELMSDLQGPVAASVPAYHLYGLLFSALAPFCGKLSLLGALGYLGEQRVSAPPLKLLIDQGQADGLVSVPAHLHALLATDAPLLTQVKKIFSSSAPLLAGDGHGILRLEPAPELVEVWGSTETGGVAARVNDPAGIWRPFPGLICASEDQCLKLRSPFTPLGISEPYLTTDKIQLTEGGFIHCGRSDGVVKVGGKRVALQDLERCALEHPLVKDAACVAVEATGIRNQTIAMAVVAAESGLTESSLLAHLSLHFDDVVLPRRVRLTTSLPRTETGKLKRQDLLALFTKSSMPKPHTASPMQLKLIVEQAGFCDVVLEELNADGESLSFNFEVRTHPEQLWFQGHFPKAPILPGVVQMKKLVLDVAQLIWPDLGELSSLSKVKFKRPIVPGDKLRVSLVHTPQKGTVTFTLLWLENNSREQSPLEVMLPHVFALPAPAETSSGVLFFKKELTPSTGVES